MFVQSLTLFLLSQIIIYTIVIVFSYDHIDTYEIAIVSKKELNMYLKSHMPQLLNREPAPRA